MSTRSFIHPIRIIPVLLAITLCGALAASALADRDGDKSRGRSGRDSADNHSMRSDGGQDHRSDRSGSRPESSRDDHKWSGPQSGRNDRDRNSGSVSKPSPVVRNDNHLIVRDDNRPVVRNDNRPVVRNDNHLIVRDDNRPVVRNDGRWDRIRLPAPDRDRDQRRYEPKVCTPQVRIGPLYRYPTRPSSRPVHYSHWVFGSYDPVSCRRSVYFHFGYFPYVQVTRVHTTPYVQVGFRAGPIVISGTYYLSNSRKTELDSALSDIRGAWLNGRTDLISDHLRTARDIAVLLDGRYDYSLGADDYAQMTADAMDEMQTISFTWESVRERADGAYTAFGKHVYRDPDGVAKTVYVSYTVRGIAGDYYIEEVGSSTSPLG